MTIRERLVFTILAVAVAACAGRQAGPELALIYNPAAQYHGPDRNPIIVIPGILGSRLRDRVSGTLVWGAFGPGAADPGEPTGARLVALPIHGNTDLVALRDDVEPDGVLDRVKVRLLGIPIEIQAYAQVLATLGAGGYRDQSLGLGGGVDYGDDHFTCFQFSYDWRRDNVENARRLHAFILEKQAYVREEYRQRYGIENAEIKFDIAAHSMGGLVARYFLMYGSQELPADGSLPALTWEGARHVERVVFLGTPNAGSVDALLELVEGKRVGPLLPFYPAGILGTFPAVYQLLPRARHRAVVWDGDAARPVQDLLDSALWERMNWGLASSDDALLALLMTDVDTPEERRRLALEGQRMMLERARRFQAAMDRPAVPPRDLSMYLVAGDSVPTTQRVAVDAATGALQIVERGPGDGIVLRASALLDERPGHGEPGWTPRVQTPLHYRAVMLLPAEHLGLTRSAVFRDNVLYWLLEAPAVR